ncbi:hypothetical protein [Teredinibacter turnerae]|uniref:hypothetical protein n=1 Tax=Teredinibacter turnerae TaxID=2426 RepID=UPI0030D1400B
MKILFIFVVIWLTTISLSSKSEQQCHSNDILNAACPSESWSNYSKKLSEFEKHFEAELKIKIVNHYNAIPFNKLIDRNTIQDSETLLKKGLAQLELWQAIKYKNGKIQGTIFQLDLGGITEGKPVVEAHLSRNNIFGYKSACPSYLGSYYGVCYKELGDGWLLLVRRIKAYQPASRTYVPGIVFTVNATLQ